MKSDSKASSVFFNAINRIRAFRPINSVPPELKGSFDLFQLKNSVSRIRILGVLIVCFRLLIIAISFGANDVLRGKIAVGLFDYMLFASFILYNLFVYYYSHKNKNYRLLWTICYLTIFFYCAIALSGMVIIGTSTNAPAMVVPLLFFTVLLPDFRPKIFISFLVFLYIAVMLIFIRYRELSDSFIVHENWLFISNMFIIIAVTKISLYNVKVGTFTHISTINELNKQLLAANENLKALSITDELTKLNNRRSFLEYTDITWKQCHRLNLPITVLMIDVDYFKKYNDSLGHLEGDKALIAIATCLKNNIKRETDFVARFGGEEFVCLLPFIEKDNALEFANSLVQVVEDMKIPHPMSSHSKYVTISVGMASVVPNDNNSHKQLLDDADKALYSAKESGRNRAVVK